MALSPLTTYSRANVVLAINPGSTPVIIVSVTSNEYLASEAQPQTIQCAEAIGILGLTNRVAAGASL